MASKRTLELQQATNAVVLPLVADPRVDIKKERAKVLVFPKSKPFYHPAVH